MEFEETAFWKFWKKYGQHITAITIVFFLIFSVTTLIKYNNLQKEISKNCGWGEEKYYCYCEKSEAMAIKNKVEQEINLSFLENVELGK